jgi:hypothetical protein
MNQNQSEPNTSTGAWDLRHPGLIMKDGEREVHEFTGPFLCSSQDEVGDCCIYYFP